MSVLYHKNPSTNEFTQLTYKDFGAAPRLHIHQGDSIGMISMEQGGLFNTTNAVTELKLFTGPIIYNKYNQLDQEYTLTDGVYFANSKNDSYIQIGMPGWEQGAIPFKTENEQLEQMYRQIPLNQTLYIPKAICNGFLNSAGTKFTCTLRIFYLIPEGTKSILMSGEYVIRQNGFYLFTSGNNYIPAGYEQPFTNKPSNISTPQTIVNSFTNGYHIHWDDTDRPTTTATAAEAQSFQRYGGSLRATRVVPRNDDSVKQTVSYTSQITKGGETTTAVGAGYLTGTVTFYNLKLTFKDTI